MIVWRYVLRHGQPGPGSSAGPAGDPAPLGRAGRPRASDAMLGLDRLDLVDHVVQTPAKFAAMVRGEQVDWAAPTPHAADPVATYRENAKGLLAAWVRSSRCATQTDWQCAEISVHTWDLATALGTSTDALDPEVADRGRAFHAGIAERRQPVPRVRAGTGSACARPTPTPG